MRRTSKAAFRVAAAHVLAAAGAMMAGCNIVTPIAYAIHGPPKIQAAHALDRNRSHVIIIDDPGNQASMRRLRSDMAQRAQQELLNRKVVTDMVDGRTVLAVLSNERHSEPMSIVEIGRAVDAEVVIYVLLTQFSLGQGVADFAPTAQMQIKVIDVESGARAWPDSRDGYPLVVRLGNQPGPVPTDTSGAIRAEQTLAQRAGLAIAQVFYKHEVTQDARR